AEGEAGDGDHRHLIDPSLEDLHRGGGAEWPAVLLVRAVGADEGRDGHHQRAVHAAHAGWRAMADDHPLRLHPVGDRYRLDRQVDEWCGAGKARRALTRDLSMATFPEAGIAAILAQDGPISAAS